MKDPEKLKFILILCSICLKEDSVELKRFIKVCARHVETEDFNKILRKSMKYLEDKRCGSISCPDWLMGNLFNLYKLEVN
jgi:hypothetical protein